MRRIEILAICTVALEKTFAIYNFYSANVFDNLLTVINFLNLFTSKISYSLVTCNRFKLFPKYSWYRNSANRFLFRDHLYVSFIFCIWWPPGDRLWYSGTWAPNCSNTCLHHRCNDTFIGKWWGHIFELTCAKSTVSSYVSLFCLSVCPSVCLSVCLSGCTQGTLYTTTTVYGLLVHQEGAICTTQAQYAPRCTRETMFFLKFRGPWWFFVGAKDALIRLRVAHKEHTSVWVTSRLSPYVCAFMTIISWR